MCRVSWLGLLNIIARHYPQGHGQFNVGRQPAYVPARPLGPLPAGVSIDESRGGMRTYATMLRNAPDFLIHSGDNIYAGVPIPAEQKFPGGGVWRNIVTEEKSKPAETLAEFRGNYKYNLLNKNVRAFNAAVAIFTQWDDHEVTNNWWPGEPLTRAEHQRKHYVEKNALLLAARANRAFPNICRCETQSRRPVAPAAPATMSGAACFASRSKTVT